MVQQDGGYNTCSPLPTPLLNVQIEDHWRNFGNSLSAVSLGFVVTAILISMVLVMSIFERFLKPTSGRSHGDVESHIGFNAKLGPPSPKMTVYANGVSVLMPGENIPTFIAHPVPVPCPPEGISHPTQQHIINSLHGRAANFNTDSSSNSTRQLNI